MGRARKRRDAALAHLQAAKEARASSRRANTRPAHDLASYVGDYEHPAYGVMSIKQQGGDLHWSWRGMFASMVHRR